MDYPVGLSHILNAAKQCSLGYDFTEPSTVDASDLSLFPSGLADEVRRFGYLGGIEVPWVAEELYLYKLDEISVRQEGYRSSSADRPHFNDWDIKKCVIADWSGDPVSVDNNGEIWNSKHSQGKWEYFKIAVDLQQFYFIVGRWMELFVIEKKRKVLDTSFEVTQVIRDEVRSRIINTSPEMLKKNLMEFIFP